MSDETVSDQEVVEKIDEGAKVDVKPEDSRVIVAGEAMELRKEG
jgi:hypothetical protein